VGGLGLPGTYCVEMDISPTNAGFPTKLTKKKKYVSASKIYTHSRRADGTNHKGGKGSGGIFIRGVRGSNGKQSVLAKGFLGTVRAGRNNGKSIRAEQQQWQGK